MTYRKMREELLKLKSETITRRLAKIAPTHCFGEGKIDKSALISQLQDWEVAKIYDMQRR